MQRTSSRGAAPKSRVHPLMASIWGSPPQLLLLHRLPALSLRFSIPTPLFNPFSAPVPPICAAARRVGTPGGTQGSAMLRRPLISSSPSPEDREPAVLSDDEASGEGRRITRIQDGEELLDWEDRILAETVPLVGFVRMILGSGTYESGDRLSPEHEKMIIERLLQYHPEFEKKIGCGIDFITIGYHPEFENSRCLFIVRKDGKLVDISYWKCIKGLIRKKYPLYADNFILRHFRRRTRYAE